MFIRLKIEIDLINLKHQFLHNSLLTDLKSKQSSHKRSSNPCGSKSTESLPKPISIIQSTTLVSGSIQEPDKILFAGDVASKRFSNGIEYRIPSTLQSQHCLFKDTERRICAEWAKIASGLGCFLSTGVETLQALLVQTEQIKLYRENGSGRVQGLSQD
ncbi:hypothetical protein RRG08_015614 [Elysia crispata]|uniref:Uncharacterized protein n=1 Tax=Elysia crispata TaxID=231223 RepID=A0AAE0YHD0_9GAST|nr:hypothetical protein RRG08_015614 [Elysia crispata]